MLLLYCFEDLELIYTQPHRKGISSVMTPYECVLKIYKGGNEMKAIIETGGKQYYVSEGSVIYVEKLDGAEGDKVVFDKVLMANGVVGNPYVASKVEGVIVKQGKQKKITVFRYKPNKRSTRIKKGHRQPYTKVEIKKIK